MVASRKWRLSKTFNTIGAVGFGAGMGINMNFAICDDDLKITDYICHEVNEFFLSKINLFKIDKYQSGTELINSGHNYDVIFLEILMEDMDGIEVAKKIRCRDLDCKIIFVTNFDMRVKAYQVHAFDYIQKPLTKEKMKYIMNEIEKYCLQNNKSEPEYLFECKEKLLKIPLSSIYYFEYINRKICIHTKMGMFTLSSSIKTLKEKYEKMGFAVPHKSFLINLDHVEKIASLDIIMANGKIVNLSQKRSVKFKEQFNFYLQKKYIGIVP